MNHLKLSTDHQLILLYTNGENRAFDVLLERYKVKVHSYISYVIKDPDLAEDFFQETFIKAIFTIKQRRYVESGKFGGWLCRIAHNLIIDHYRQERNEQYVSYDNANIHLLNSIHLSEGTIEDMLITTQVATDVRRLIRMLPTSQQEVLTMRYYKDLSFKEIAELTGVSINTALGRMRYALINMRRIAKENGMNLE